MGRFTPQNATANIINVSLEQSCHQASYVLFMVRLSTKLGLILARQNLACGRYNSHMSLSEGQLYSTAIASRVSSACSAAGVFAIFSIFSYSRYFRSPIHRVIFYTAFYNLAECVATLISVSGPAAGDTSSLCQFQAFALQMFPLADVLWTLAMALDVYLVTFHHFDGRELQKLEMTYALVFTVLTFIPAFVFLFIRSPTRGPLYGGVIVWCSIRPDWTVIRVVLYYVPVWLVIAIILVLYCLVGVKIWILQSDVEFVSHDYDYLTPASTGSQTSDRTTSSNTTTFESQCLNEIVRGPVPDPTTIQSSGEQNRPSSSTPVRSQPSMERRLSFRQYILVPLLFFSALLVTWIAPTFYRIHLFHHPNYTSYPLLLAISILFPLRGFWNAIIFVTMGVKGWTRNRVSERRHVRR